MTVFDIEPPPVTHGIWAAANPQWYMNADWTLVYWLLSHARTKASGTIVLSCNGVAFAGFVPT